MGTTWIKNADVITLNERGDILHRSDIVISEGRILSIGDTPPGFCADEIIDAADHVVLPGFFNAHTHAPMTLERGWADDLPFDRWLNDRIWVAESADQGRCPLGCLSSRGGDDSLRDRRLC